jgi:glycosyltransferase involved in cell wall biosynthesis
MKLSVVIPASNEADNISTTLTDVGSQVASTGAELEAIIVDDHPIEHEAQRNDGS